MSKKQITCFNCKEINPASNIYCSVCGDKLSEAEHKTKIQRLFNFMHVFNFTLEDWAYNLTGRLTANQVKKIKRNRIIYAAIWNFAAMFFSLFFVAAFSESFTLGFMAWFILVGFIIWITHKQINEVVSQHKFLTRKATMAQIRSGGSGRKNLVLGDYTFAVHPKAWQVLSSGEQYTIHFVSFFEASMILSFAPSDSEVTIQPADD